MRFHLLLLGILPLASGSFIHIREESQLHASYDYIIVGGGTSGLTVGNRLSEDPSKTVLIIEAGAFMSEPDYSTSLIPGNIYASVGPLGKRWDWNVTCVPNRELNNRTTWVQTRKVVGGASSTNAMFFTRGSRRDYDDWAEYVGDKSWGFDALLPYFRKSETFHDPPEIMREELGVSFEEAAVGRKGPIHASYPPFYYPYVKLWVKAYQWLGIKVPKESRNGDALGSLWVPSSVDPRDQTRSFARTGYHEQAKGRKNYHLITERQVTQILFKNKRAVGVKYAAGPDSPVQTTTAKKEIILSSGGVHSPKLLQLSGVADKRLLNKLKISVVADSPGVGQNYQDHPVIYTTYNFTNYQDGSFFSQDPSWVAAAAAEYAANRTGPLTVGVGQHAAFHPLPLISPRHKSLISTALSADDTLHLPPSTHPSVLRGYRRAKAIQLRSFTTNKAGIIEQVSTAVSLSRPLSRGTVEITTSDPWTLPAVDFRTLTNVFDKHVLLDSVRFLRRVVDAPVFVEHEPVEVLPGREKTSDEELMPWVREWLEPTWWHSTGTCAAGRWEDGAVVDRWFRVYGVKGLRVVDTSVFPLVPATHTSSTAYALAEMAADVIKRTSN